MFARNSLASLFLLLGMFAFGQELDSSSLIEQRIEALTEFLDVDTELDYTTLFDRFSRYLDKPLNLNAARQEELERLMFLSEFQIQSLLRHIAKHGKLLNLHELQAVEGFDLGTIRSVQPFVSVAPPGEFDRLSWESIKSEGSHDLVMRWQMVLEEQAGFANENTFSSNAFEGSRARLFARYRFRYKNNISIGFTAEKDPGEAAFSGSNPQGFDFYSGHVYFQDKGLVRKVALGDYQVQVGQGITAWSGLAFGKSSFVMNVKRRGQGIRPYNSVDENRFMRGAAFTLGFSNLEWTNFFSSKSIDANIIPNDTLLDPDQVAVSSFQLTGLHRTIDEIADRDAIRERYAGSNIKYSSRNFSLGLTGIYSDYNADVSRNLSVYNQFDFNDGSNSVVGADYHWLVGNVNLFGEASRSRSGGWAYMQGALFALHPNLSASVIHRNYAKDYQNLLALPFGELSRPANERGTCIGMEWRLNTHWTVNAYADQFRFPWLRFRVDAPSVGVDHFVQLNYRPSRGSEFYARFRQRSRSRNAMGSDAVIDFPVPESRRQFRLNAAYEVSDAFRLKTRAEWVTYDLGGQAQDGFLMYQDVIYKPIGKPLSLSLRYALFDIEDWDARIYAYESDLLFSWSIPPYFGRGARMYAMVKWDIYRKIDLWIRYSQWYYTDRNTVGSGLNQIDGNTKSELKVQLRWRF